MDLCNGLCLRTTKLLRKIKDLSITLLPPTVIIAFASFMIFLYLNADLFSYPKELSQLGTLGDFFGGLLNPFLSFCAFLILVKTLKSSERNHEEALDTQRFFGLISLTHESARGVEISFPTPFKKKHTKKIKQNTKKSTYQNHLAIGRAWKELKCKLPTLQGDRKNIAYEQIYIFRMQIYLTWRKCVWQWIGSYFETVLFIIQKYAIRELLKDKSADGYLRTIRHQMTTGERNILFYEMLASEVYHKYMRLLHSHYFWRGGGDGLDEHRLDLITQAEEHFKKVSVADQ